MPQKWRATVTVGQPEPSVAELIEQSLPADTLPAYVGVSGDMRLSAVMVTAEAEGEEQAAQQAQAMVKEACVVAGWNWEPTVGTVVPKS
jgi:hypothetical protein